MRESVDERDLWRVFNGEYRAGWDELVTWTFAIGNISVLSAVGSLDELVPSVGGDPGELWSELQFPGGN